MIELYGSTFIADAIGMERAALSNHLSRSFDTVPAPVAVLRESQGRWKHPRYLWDDSGLAEWREWKSAPMTLARNGAPTSFPLYQPL